MLLITGADGQVGRELLALCHARGLEATGTDVSTLDVTDSQAAMSAVGDLFPDAVVNAAAYTAVDRAEADPETATAVNRDGAANIARACAQFGVPLVHVSTDYVFDGLKGAVYTAADAVSPLGVYGRTKAEGEAAVAHALAEHVVIRTAWVFSAHGHNFARTMLRLARERETVGVVADQWGGPTAAAAVAEACLVAAQKSVSSEPAFGLFQFAGAPAASWFDFATEIVRVGAALDPSVTGRIVPIETSAYPTPAARPARVEMDTAPFSAAFGLPAPDWRADLVPVVERLVESARAGAA